MEQAKFDRAVGYFFKSDGKEIADPWARLAAAMIKRALWELLLSCQREPNQEVLTWLKSDEAAWVCEGGGADYYRIRRFVDKYGSGNPKSTRRFTTVKRTIKNFDDRGGVYDPRRKTRQTA